MDYDDWKLATPWDDEVSISVSFECQECEYENESIDSVIGRGDLYVEEFCEECNASNQVYLGE